MAVMWAGHANVLAMSFTLSNQQQSRPNNCKNSPDELRGQLANSGLPGKWPLKWCLFALDTYCVLVVTYICDLLVCMCSIQASSAVKITR